MPEPKFYFFQLTATDASTIINILYDESYSFEHNATCDDDLKISKDLEKLAQALEVQLENQYKKGSGKNEIL